MYTLTNGSRVKSARTWDEAMTVAGEWSSGGQVISVLQGSHTQTYVYRGREITGLEANRIWMDQETYDGTTYAEAVM